MSKSTDAADTTSLDYEAAREAILKAALAHVPFDGWTHGVLQQAARDAGFDKVTALRVFPGGPIEAITYWSHLADRRMLEDLESRDLASMKVRERVATAIRVRLERTAPHREALSRALGVLAMPLNTGRGTALLWRTVDAIWYAAGDNATDFNYYTKRALLAGVYSATLLYWLDDRSPGSADSWAFLDRRIAEVMSVPRTLGEIGKRLSTLPSRFSLFRPRRF